MDPLLADLACALVPRGASVVTPAGIVASVLASRGVDARMHPLAGLADGEAQALVLLADEVSHEGDRAETLVAEAARVLRPGGLLFTSAAGSVWASLHGTAVARPFDSDGLAAMLGHAGFAVEGRYAPGAAARLAGAAPCFDAEADRLPGLLDAAERVVAVARRYRSDDERSQAFFGSLPRKVVAAAVLCRDASGALLAVHDSFKQHWTIPGGVVDADEDPRAGAAREAYEETGLRVEVGDLLGVFSASWPDRLVFVFAGEAEPGSPFPVHAHEIDDVAWMPLPAALATLAPHVAGQVRRCLAAPGTLWPHP